ncbi:MAG: KH domain-containing protein [Nanoarchaeota archaeon]
MKKLYVSKVRKVSQNKNELEKNLDVKISISGRNISVDGKEVDEYFASRVIEALDYPFFPEDALLLKDENYMLEVLDIKDYTRRKDFGVIRGRIIGTNGRTLRVLRDLTGCEIVVENNNVAIIGKAEHILGAVQAVISLIQGSKQGNVYARLEHRNKE